MRKIKARVIRNIGTEAAWLQKNPLLGDGEMALVRFGSRVRNKIGNGSLTFSQLSYQDSDLKIAAATPSFPFVSGEGPAPAGIYMANGSGKYNGNLDVNTDGKLVMLIWDGVSKLESVETDMPMPQIVEVLNPVGEKVPTEKATANYIDSLLQVVDKSNKYNVANNVSGKYVHSTGVIMNAVNVIMNVFPVSKGTYAVKSNNWNSSAFFIAIRDSASTDTGSTLGILPLQPTSDPEVRLLVIEDDSTATHAFINVKLPNVAFDISSVLVINEGNAIIPATISKVNNAVVLDEKAVHQNDLSGIGPLYLAANNISNKYVVLPQGNIGSTTSAALLNVFPVEEKSTYAVYSDSYQANSFAIAFRESNSVADGTTLGLAALQTTSDPKVRTFTTTVGAKFGFINVRLPNSGFDITGSVKINKGSTIITGPTVMKIGDKEIADNKSRTDIEVIKTQINGIIISILKGLKWVIIGDSITEKNYRSLENYHYYLAQNVGGMTRYNYGLSGTGFFDRFNVADTITQTEIDLISLFWGTNDWGNQNANNKKLLGAFLDTGTDTISGCINTCLTKLIAKFPTTPIVLFTPLPRGNNWGLTGVNNAYGYNLLDFCNLLKKYAQHYSLPILDLYSESGLFPWNADSNDFYFKAPDYSAGDALHPNDEGHKFLANKIRIFLESNVA